MRMPLSQSLDRPLEVGSLARTFNAQNQLVTDGTATPGFDAIGNVTTDDHGNTLVYDSWNRLVEVKASNGTIISGYTYDGYEKKKGRESLMATKHHTH